MKILEYIQHESERQSATLEETINMVEAWRYVRDFQSFPNIATIAHIAYLINGTRTTRTMPAVFNQGRPALDARLIPRALTRWHEYAPQALAASDDLNETVDEFTKEFLEIHPFADGNGRVASLLYNYMRGTIMDPAPLPYYYGEN